MKGWLALLVASACGCQSKLPDLPPSPIPSAIAVAPPAAKGARAANLQGSVLEDPSTTEPDSEQEAPELPLSPRPDGGVAL